MLENIPVISTYTTLHNEYGVQPEDIDMFVIGTGDFIDEKSWTVEEVNSWSLMSTLKNLLIPYLTDSNEQTSVFWGLQMGFNSFTFFNPVRISGKMDNPKVMEDIEKECLKNKEEFLEAFNRFLNK